MPYFALMRVKNQRKYQKGMQSVIVPGQGSSPSPTLSSNADSGLRILQHYGQQLKGALHVPQTLDQYHDQSLAEIDSRITDQVLYRHQGLLDEPVQEQERLICMVDQLWLYVVDDGMFFERDAGYATLYATLTYARHDPDILLPASG